MHNARLFYFSSDTNTNFNMAETFADTESLAPSALKFRSGRKNSCVCTLSKLIEQFML